MWFSNSLSYPNLSNINLSLMKKFPLLLFTCCLCLGLISWGTVGHKTIAQIAERHLTPEARKAIHDLLGNQSLADISNWADEVRTNPQFQNTVSWHALYVPPGLTMIKFKRLVEHQKAVNVFYALFNNENVFYNSSATREQKISALKFIIHLVGDAHQLIHISGTGYKDGSEIQVNYAHQLTSLDSLWQDKLVTQQGWSFTKMAKKYDSATPDEIKDWQDDGPMDWLYESYQISTKLYAGVDDKHKPDADFYKENMPIIEQQLDKAGIRLAGVLNKLFKSR